MPDLGHSGVSLADLQRQFAQVQLEFAVRALKGSKRRPPNPAKAAKYAENAARHLRWSLR